MNGRNCRFCASPLAVTFCDLGVSPLSNAFLSREQLTLGERFYPLHAFVCGGCMLVQLEQFETPEQIFGDYAYFSSYSESWLEHCRAYAQMAIHRFRLGTHSQVIEIASNDGYLLQYFKASEVPVLGIEPAANVAAIARERGISTRVEFFGANTADRLRSEGIQADLLIGNNVLAHVPDLNDFVAGVRIALASDGVATFEFPHLMRLMDENQFDTIYHEHFSYFSLLTARRVFTQHQLSLFDVEERPTHGGSLRVYVGHAGRCPAVTERVHQLEAKERANALDRIEGYEKFTVQVQATKRALLSFLIDAKSQGKRVVGYGAPAKGNTLLNYCGIRQDFLDFTVDRNPHKQGRFLPGSRIPVLAPDAVKSALPDYLLILPWNLRDEVMQQMAYIRQWGGRFVVPIPQVQVFQ